MRQRKDVRFAMVPRSHVEGSRRNQNPGAVCRRLRTMHNACCRRSVRSPGDSGVRQSVACRGIQDLMARWTQVEMA